MEWILCPWEKPEFFIYSSNVPPILYYALIPGMLMGLFLGIFIFFKGEKNLQTKLLFFVLLTFFIWGLLDLFLFATNSPLLVMWAWSLTILVEALIYVASFYLAVVFIKKKDISLISKFGLLSLLSPVILFLPTSYNLVGVNTADCTAIEGPIALYYSYGLEIFVVLGILFAYFFNRKSIKESSYKRAAGFFTTGLLLFLLFFSSGNIIGSFTSDWVTSQYGYFGMPIFIGFLGYLIVKFKAFDVKLIGAQALVFAQFALIGSMLFFAQSLTNRILIGATLVIVSGAGWYLIRSVKKEIEQKEQYEKISHTLAIANERLKELDATKSEFISIASHQLRTPLTAIKGYLSLLLEGSYGSVSPQVLDILNKLYLVNSRLVHLVEDLLNVSRIEAGRIQYNFEPTQLEPIIVDLVEMFKSSANEKNLTLDIHLPKTALPLITVDPNKIKEVVSNLIDNSIKYTKVGGTTVTLERTPLTARIIISDTGIGIHPEDMKNLFQKFLRSKETTKMVVSGAGLGLYVGKSFIEAHGGTIWAESDGPDKGARFIIELPLHNEKIKVGTSDEPTSAEKG